MLQSTAHRTFNSLLGVVSYPNETITFVSYVRYKLD